MNRKRICLWLASIFLLLPHPLWAATIEHPLPDVAQEAQAQQIFGQLRCMVCAGQSLADSDATLAADMRAHVRHLLQEGKAPEEVLASFVAAYGDPVLMAPPLHGPGSVLWALPVLVSGAGVALLWRMRRKGAV